MLAEWRAHSERSVSLLTFWRILQSRFLNGQIIALSIIVIIKIGALFRLFLDFLDFGALILKPNLFGTNERFKYRALNGKIHSMKKNWESSRLTWTMRKLRPVSLAKFSRTLRHGFGDTSKDALNALRCCVFNIVRGRFGPRRPSIFAT